MTSLLKSKGQVEGIQENLGSEQQERPRQRSCFRQRRNKIVTGSMTHSRNYESVTVGQGGACSFTVSYLQPLLMQDSWDNFCELTPYLNKYFSQLSNLVTHCFLLPLSTSCRVLLHPVTTAVWVLHNLSFPLTTSFSTL